MKILHAYNDFDPPVHGGIERHMALMCRYQRAWADTEALTCSRSAFTRRVERDGTRVTEAGEFGRFQSAPVSPMFPWYLGRSRADVVVIHSPCPTAEVAWLMRHPKGKLIVRYHSDVVRQAAAMRLYERVLMKLLTNAAIIIPTSAAYVRSSPFLTRVTGKCRVVPLGVEPELFAAAPERRVRELQERYGRYVLFAGRHRYYKGIEHLIEASAAIRARVVVAGEGPLTAELKRRAAKTGDRVVFTGRLEQPDLVAHLHGCAVFVFPSVARSEAFGLSILEAHACGKPVVATRLGTGVEYANLDGETGLNVRPGDPAALSEAVNTLLEDTALAERFGARGRERITAEFDVRDIARREFELYRDA